jgi:hypothetical protein
MKEIEVSVQVDPGNPGIREMYEKVFKENPPALDYDELAIIMEQIALELKNIEELVSAVINNTVKKKESMLPVSVGLLKKHKIIDKLPLMAKKAKDKEGYTRYVLVRMFISSIMCDIFATGWYEEEGKLKPLLSLYMLYSTCYKKFDDPNFVFAMNFEEKFIALEKYVSDIKPFLDEPHLKKCILKLNGEDFNALCEVFIAALKETKECVEVSEKESDSSKNIYPKISFIDNALFILQSFVSTFTEA